MSAAATKPELTQVPQPEPPLVQRIAAAMAEAASVAKDSRNSQQNYDYASVEAMLAAVRGPLYRRGIVLIQHPREDLEVEQEIKSSKGQAGVRVIAACDFEFSDGVEQYRVAGWKAEGQDFGDKAWAKARTALLKTFIRSQWLLPVEENDQQLPDRAPAESQAPRWSQVVAGDTVVKHLREQLAPLLGGEDKANAYIHGLAAKTGGQLPNVVAAWAAALPDWIAAASAAPAPDAPAPDELPERQADEPAPQPAVQQQLDPPRPGVSADDDIPF